MSGKWTQTPLSSNEQDIPSMALSLLRLYKPLQCYAMFCLCVPSSPFPGRLVCFCVNMSLLLSVKLCLMLVSSLSPCCLSFGPTHAFFHPTATFSNCTEVMDSDVHLCIRTAFSLCLIVQIPMCSAFTYYHLSAQSQYLYTQKPHVVSLYLPKNLCSFTNSVSQGTECKKWQHGKLCFEEVL